MDRRAEVTGGTFRVNWRCGFDRDCVWDHTQFATVERTAALKELLRASFTMARTAVPMISPSGNPQRVRLATRVCLRPERCLGGLWSVLRHRLHPSAGCSAGVTLCGCRGALWRGDRRGLASGAGFARGTEVDFSFLRIACAFRNCSGVDHGRGWVWGSVHTGQRGFSNAFGFG